MLKKLICSKGDKTQKLKQILHFKTQIVTKLKKNVIVTKLKNSDAYNLKSQIVTKFKKFNCDKKSKFQMSKTLK